MRRIFAVAVILFVVALCFSQQSDGPFFPLVKIDKGFGLVSEKAPETYKTNKVFGEQNLLVKLGCEDVLAALSDSQTAYISGLKRSDFGSSISVTVGDISVVVFVSVKVILDSKERIQARIVSVSPLEGVDTAAKDTSAPTTEKPAKTGPTVYEVKRGDTLESIAKKYSTTIAALKAMNGIGKKEALQAGRVLVIYK